MKKGYSIKNNFLILRDKKGTDFHVERKDYFGTLATVLSLIEQNNIEENKKEIKSSLKKIIKDLLYLQDNYEIIKKA